MQPVANTLIEVPGFWLLAGVSMFPVAMSMRKWWPGWWRKDEGSSPKPPQPGQPSRPKKKNAALQKQLARLEEENSSLQERIADLEQQREQLEHQLAQLQQQLEQLQPAGSSREKLVRELVDLIRELHRLGQSQDVAAPLARHVLHTLFQALERSGVEVIRDEQYFDPRRHWPVPFDDTAEPGHPVAETLLPGVALDGQVLLRAEVRLAPRPDSSSHSQETSHD